ncbi:hypothetical protein Godav_000090 [Gossypium davidsonii]|uniref:BHLH domain-containing protein n=2 Tax=Gossypium TaxID=3633 RepID=A0A7J8TGE1_GOSDV|nr:hypothetical protein [Gossypium davidsonii]MBA0671696.1 hypothetical protein [Gossypium klotzschianum]
MNRALPEILQRSDMTVKEQSYFNELSGVISTQSTHVHSFHGGLMSDDSVLTREGKEPSWYEFGKLEMATLGFQPCEYGNEPSFNIDYSISRTSSRQPPVLAAVAASEAAENMGSSAVVEDGSIKKIKACEEEEKESKITGPPSTTIKSNSYKANSKVSEVQKPDYIHVRARRGQATDSHSLSERVRREKISERLKYLQNLVPGCNKITGKAGMLDEIINYVQSLQRQVEVFPRVGNGISSDMAKPFCYLHFNPETVVRGTVCVPDTPIWIQQLVYVNAANSTTFCSAATLDVELQNLYNVGI